MIRAPELGLLATVGSVSGIEVRPKAKRVNRTIKIGILSSGNELVEATSESPLPSGKIRDSNKCMLMAIASDTLLGSDGDEVVDLGSV